VVVFLRLGQRAASEAAPEYTTTSSRPFSYSASQCTPPRMPFPLVVALLDFQGAWPGAEICHRSTNQPHQTNRCQPSNRPTDPQDKFGETLSTATTAAIGAAAVVALAAVAPSPAFVAMLTMFGLASICGWYTVMGEAFVSVVVYQQMTQLPHQKFDRGGGVGWRPLPCLRRHAHNVRPCLDLNRYTVTDLSFTPDCASFNLILLP
jgi:hypothetical protein